MIIGIFSTIDLLRAVLFTYVPLERMPNILRVTIVITSLGSKNLKELSLKRQKVSTSNRRFLMTIIANLLNVVYFSNVVKESDPIKVLNGA